MSTTTVVPAEQRTLLREITWDTYERLLDERGETSVPRLTYDRGVLEIMGPGKRHETLASLVKLLVGVVSEEWAVAVTDLGSMTFKNPEWDRGFEPDGCFYVGDAAEAVMRLERIDPSVDPAPNVVVEIDISHDSTDKRDLLAQFGVPEVWRHDGDRLTILVLEGEGYAPAESSLAFPLLTADSLTALLAQRERTPSPQWLRHVRAWAGDAAATA